METDNKELKFQKTPEQQAVEEWVNDWKFRLTPAASSKVLQKWKRTGIKPKPKSEEEQAQERIQAASTPNQTLEKIADTLHGIGVGASVAGGLEALTMAPATTVAGLLGGVTGGKTVDAGSKLITGKTWSDNVKEKLNLQTNTLAELSNPGAWIGGGLGIKGLNMAKQRLLNAAYNNFTPLGYTDTDKLPFMNHKNEIKDIIKEFITPKRINTSNTTYPKWYQRAMEYAEKAKPERGFGNNGMSFENLIKYRDEAWRLATNQKPRLGLYKPNGDGTYSYNMDVINQLEGGPKVRTFIVKNAGNDLYTDFNGMKLPTIKDSAIALDEFASNGGFTNMKLGPHKLYPTTNKNLSSVGKPSFTIEDIWDLQPFKDAHRTFYKPITDLGTKYPKIFGKLKDIEVLEPLGGNPFKLKQTFPEGTARIFIRPNVLK